MPLSDEYKAQLATVSEAIFRQTLHETIAAHTDDPGEQLLIQGTVVSLMMRRLYLGLGQAWLETALTGILQPETGPTKGTPPS